MVWLFAILTMAGIAYLIAAERVVRHFAQQQRAITPAALPGITIFKPLYGAEPGLEANLRSFLVQAYPTFQVIFGLQQESDPALPIVKGLVADFPNLDLTIVVNTTRHGANGKVSNLMNMLPSAKYEIFVLADSDMRVAPDYLTQLYASLNPPDVGAVTCLYLGRPEPGLPAIFGAAFINHHFLPQILISRALGNEEGCFGATIALRRQTFDKIGGFEALADVLADDHEIGRRVRGLGLRVALAPMAIDDVVNEPSWGHLARHELRWARTIRLANPAGFLASVITLPVAIATLGVVLSGGDIAALLMLGLAFSVRIWFQLRLDRLLGLDLSPIWLSPVRDSLTFAMIILSFLGRRVSWRGAEFQVNPDGSLLVGKDEQS